MPIYEYICQKCSQTHEFLQKMSDAPLVDCPACHQPSLIKQVSAAAFHLKGGGWYATDFKGNKTEKPADAACSKPACQTTGTCQSSTATNAE